MIISTKYRRRLVVMVKEPRPGRVKTRLGRDIGMTAAAWWFRHQTHKILRQLQDPRWELILAVSPDYEGLKSRVWPNGIARIAQGRGDLGVRMKAVFDKLPPGPICIIGTDIPAVTCHEIWRAFDSLGSHDATFGPATDGGYWLIGLKRIKPTPPQIFQDVYWSTETALQNTINNMSGLRIGRVATLNDVDDVSDL